MIGAAQAGNARFLIEWLQTRPNPIILLSLTQPIPSSIVSHFFMKLFLKTIFAMAVLGLLVLMGLHNQGKVTFAMPPVLPKAITQPAAIMYFAFFAIGFITGRVLSSSGEKKGSSSGAPTKPAKPKLIK